MTGRLEMSISLNRPLMVVEAVNPAAGVAHAVPVCIGRESATTVIAAGKSSRRIHSLGKFNSCFRLEPHRHNGTNRECSQAVKDGIAIVSLVCREMRPFAVLSSWIGTEGSADTISAAESNLCYGSIPLLL